MSYKAKSERVKMWFNEDWFEQLMAVLYEQQDNIKSVIESTQDEKIKNAYSISLEENKKLINKIIRYGWPEEKSDEKNQVRIEFFPSEARELIWQLLMFSVMYKSFDNTTYFSDFCLEHESIKENNPEKNSKLSKKSALEIYNNSRIGRVYLVRNKNGKLYYVDHRYTELVKKEDRWEDKKYGFDWNVFVECNLDLENVKWEDERPLNIYQLLHDEGWVDDEYEFIFKNNIGNC